MVSNFLSVVVATGSRSCRLRHPPHHIGLVTIDVLDQLKLIVVIILTAQFMYILHMCML
jgi:hypothetical protein